MISVTIVRKFFGGLRKAIAERFSSERRLFIKRFSFPPRPKTWPVIFKSDVVVIKNTLARLGRMFLASKEEYNRACEDFAHDRVRSIKVKLRRKRQIEAIESRYYRQRDVFFETCRLPQKFGYSEVSTEPEAYVLPKHIDTVRAELYAYWLRETQTSKIGLETVS